MDTPNNAPERASFENDLLHQQACNIQRNRQVMEQQGLVQPQEPQAEKKKRKRKRRRECVPTHFTQQQQMKCEHTFGLPREGMAWQKFAVCGQMNRNPDVNGWVTISNNDDPNTNGAQSKRIDIDLTK